MPDANIRITIPTRNSPALVAELRSTGLFSLHRRKNTQDSVQRKLLIWTIEASRGGGVEDAVRLPSIVTAHNLHHRASLLHSTINRTLNHVCQPRNTRKLLRINCKDVYCLDFASLINLLLNKLCESWEKTDINITAQQFSTHPLFETRLIDSHCPDAHWESNIETCIDHHLLSGCISWTSETQ